MEGLALGWGPCGRTGSRGGVHVEGLALGVGSMWKDWL